MDQTMTTDTAPTTDGVRFPEQDMRHLAELFEEHPDLVHPDGARRHARTIRKAIQARNDELMASREVIADLRGRIGQALTAIDGLERCNVDWSREELEIGQTGEFVWSAELADALTPLRQALSPSTPSAPATP